MIMGNPRCAHDLHLEYLNVGRAEEGELMNGILSMWMSEQTQEGERMSCMLEQIDARTDRRS